jgi:hypothetical protein
LIWSYILDYENNKNPFQERKDRIRAWKKYAIEDIQESSKIIEMARSLNKNGFPKIDSLHISCAIITQGGYFLTTDDKILKLSTVVKKVKNIIMITDTEIKLKGFKFLAKYLEDVEADRFIALIQREPFDYTKWRQGLDEELSIEEISKKAMALRTKNTKQNDEPDV